MTLLENLEANLRALIRTIDGLEPGIFKLGQSPRLTLMRGLPGSGKSTQAEKMADEDTVIVSRDQLREEGISEREEQLASEASQVEKAIAEGKSAIVDDTNLTAEDILYWREFAEQKGMRVEVIDMEPSLPTAIRRDQLRDDSVGEEAIRHHQQRRDSFEEVLVRLAEEGYGGIDWIEWNPDG